MTKQPPKEAGGPGEPLRARAEAALGAPREVIGEGDRAQLLALAHELQVHQIELEMQNEELRLAQDELQASRDRYLDLYDFAPVGYLTLNGKGVISEANLTAAELLGVERHELMGQGLSSYVAGTENDQAAYFRNRQTTLESGEMQACELQLQPQHGEPFWAQMNSAVVRDAGGYVAGMRVVLTDIGARKRAERHLELLATALDQTADAVLVTDSAGRPQFVNAAFEETTGYSREEALRGSVHLLDSGKQDQAFYQELRKTLRDCGVWRGQRVLKKGHDGEYPADESIAVIHADSGDTVGFISVHRDVSQQLILQRQLQQAQKMEAIGTLAGGVAHDFNNILMGILGYADLGIDRYPQGTEPYQYLQPIAKAGQRAAGVVHQILTFSRRAEEERCPLDMARVVDEALDLLRATLPVTIRVQRNLDPDCGTILANPAQIHQVVMNLATNAYQAMRETGGDLEVSVQPVQMKVAGVGEEEEFVQLTVRDTGAGMAPAERSRIFEPYFTTKPSGEGSGMGLAVVHGIVSALDGNITVESQPGAGSTFRICIPRLPGGGQPAEARRQEPPVGTERVLLVDDEASLAELGKLSLEARGFRVSAFTDSRTALEAFQGDPDGFDLVFTDQTMPGVTGVQLAEAVLAARPGLPVIICTGHSDVLDEAGASNLGASAFLLKPVRPSQMVETARRVLDAAASRRKP